MDRVIHFSRNTLSSACQFQDWHWEKNFKDYRRQLQHLGFEDGDATWPRDRSFTPLINFGVSPKWKHLSFQSTFSNSWG
jgi:hypothetical protein